MSLVEGQQRAERRPPPAGLDLGLPSPSTNNPFRKSPASPSFAPGFSTPLTHPASADRPTSKNPFLDNSGAMDEAGGRRLPQTSTRNDSDGEHFFDRLTLTDIPPLAPSRTAKPPRSENVPPPINGPNGNAPLRSAEEHARARAHGKPRDPTYLDIFADPQDMTKSQGRPRRNSDSSIADKKADTEEERKKRERRHRERGPRDGKSKSGSTGGRPKKQSHRLDVIDKLDVTSIYGMGLFHHDGPFDACNPHRNRKGSSKAPMSAFPKDSANNTLGGSGPINKTINLAQFHGHTADGFTDYSSSGVGSSNHPQAVYEQDSTLPRGDRTSSFNPTRLVDVVHGPETSGLGTTTFLEGAPAARVAIERRESEGESGGLSRKKSFAQKIRGINGRAGSRANIAQSPEPIYERTTSSDGAQSAGGLPKINEANPFFNDYNDAYDKKGASIRAAEVQGGQATGEKFNNVRLGPEQSTTEGNDVRMLQPSLPADEGKTAGGFMNRVKSLRGGGRGKPRAERKE